MKAADCKPLEITTRDGLKMHVVNYPALLKLNADVYLIFGMRSFGKSYGILDYCLRQWVDKKECFVMMRTIDDDITLTKARKYIAGNAAAFQEMVAYEKELTVYASDIIARSFGQGREVIREKVGSVMSLSGWLKYKGNNYDDVSTIIFEEFLERKAKLTADAFMEGYLNNLSTVIRLRQGVKVFCLANTVKKKSPIFDYYGIDLTKIKKGTPALFSEENGLKVCVYWTPDVKLEQQSTKHYTVSNSKHAKMITSGQWEESDFPITWEGFSSLDCQRLRRFRASFRFHLYDIDVYIWIPNNRDTPILFTKFSGMRARVECASTTFMLYYKAYFDIVRTAIADRRVIHDGKCADDIDYIFSRLK